jgi:hypothetical protein
MKCPHCQVEVHADFNWRTVHGNGDKNPLGKFGVDMTYWYLGTMVCPACKDAILEVKRTFATRPGNELQYLVYPRKAMRPSAPKEVPEHIAEDFNESCMVFSDSPKASAALSRRCLQAILRDKGFTQKDLLKAIQAVLDSKQLPTSISENLDAVRNIGNFAAHPLKDTLSSSIEAVEPHEAEWNLEVLEELFDFYYVQPERSKQKRAALDAKLAALGKPPMQ